MVSGNGQGCSVWYTAVVLPSPSTVPAIDGLPSFPTTARGVDITNDVLRSLWLQPEISKVTYSFEPRQGVGSGGGSEASRA